MKEGKRENLPLWARNLINHLEQSRESQKEYFDKKLREMCGETETPVIVDEYDEGRKFLPVDTRITFVLRGKDKITFHINKERDRIEIYKESGGLSPGGLNHRLSFSPGGGVNTAEVL